EHDEVGLCHPRMLLSGILSVPNRTMCTLRFWITLLGFQNDDEDRVSAITLSQKPSSRSSTHDGKVLAVLLASVCGL
ncbi:hypothetical protein AB4549_08970, partial [Vibrio breoganii]